jgi:alpha/beta superfamily hydrolase
MLREIPGPQGRLEALLDEPSETSGVTSDGLVERGRAGGIRAAVVLAHPLTIKGGTMHTKVVYQAAKALARIGCAVLRFNFRGAGRSEGTFTDGPGETEDFLAGVSFVEERYPGARIWAAGMSFGAWVAMTAGAADGRVSTLIGIAPPISRYDFTEVGASRKPKFLVHGERDEVCSVREVREFYANAAEPKELIVVDMADHLFDGKVGDVADALEDLLSDWNG